MSLCTKHGIPHAHYSVSVKDLRESGAIFHPMKPYMLTAKARGGAEEPGKHDHGFDDGQDLLKKL